MYNSNDYNSCLSYSVFYKQISKCFVKKVKSFITIKINYMQMVF